MRVEKTDEYREWIDELKDRTARARILVRVGRLIDGNPGQHRGLTDGVSELKVDWGRDTAFTTPNEEIGFCCFSSAVTSQRSRKTSPWLFTWPGASRNSDHAQNRKQQANHDVALRCRRAPSYTVRNGRLS